VANYDVPATSYVVILDKDGKIVYGGVGGDQNIARALAAALR
jgi:D-arabinose 5-phosphate isomerase GutQ